MRNSYLTSDQKEFYTKLKRYCKIPEHYSIKPFLKKNKDLILLLSQDKIFMDSVKENCQLLCFNNVIKAWRDGLFTSRRTLRYMHENYDIFRAYEQHMSKFEKIETEKQAEEFIITFLKIAIPFAKLANTDHFDKGFDARAIIEEAGYDYEEMIAKSLIVEQWENTIEVIHWACFENAQEEMIFKRKKNTTLTVEQFEEYLEELNRWRRIREGKEKPRVPCIVKLRMQEMDNSEKDETPHNLPAAENTQSISQGQAQLNAYLEQRKKNRPGFKFQAEQKDDNTFSLAFKDENKLGYDEVYAAYYSATGSTNAQYATECFTQAFNAAYFGEKTEKNITNEANAIFGALTEMSPRDITDGILCRRILILENHINQYLARAAIPNQTLKANDRYVNNAAKLSRILNETIEARTRYLRQGEQKVTVTHQHVNVQGGQAIISGNINQEGRGNEKK